MNESIRKRLLAMKISNWESIPYSVGLQCPNGDDGSLMDGKSKVIGWCDTPKGLMKVCECQVCFICIFIRSRLLLRTLVL